MLETNARLKTCKLQRKAYFIFTMTVNACLTTPTNFISEMRYSGCPTGGSTNSVNSGLSKKNKKNIKVSDCWL